MRFFIVAVVLSFVLATAAQQYPEAPTGFDNKSNGVADDATHQADQMKFDEVEGLDDGLGPLYNAQSCRECHQNPTSGGPSQITELRVGHLGPNRRFQNPEIPIARGAETITGRSLVNLRAICPSEAFPNTEIQERVPDSETIRTTRISLNLLGDGFVEAVADQTLIDLSRDQCKASHGKICGQVLYVPIVEAPGQTGVGRFGWKDQQASLLSFSGDAYINRFTRFMRATKAPARDKQLAATPLAKKGSELFDKIGCATCHVRSLTTAAAGTKINGGTFTIPDALAQKTFYPFGDFLLHNVGTGDGIVMAMQEHYGRNMYQIQWKNLSLDSFASTQNKMRTAPLWGVRLRPQLMHDGQSVTLRDAILRHLGEATQVTRRFKRLKVNDQKALIEFLKSL